MNEIWAKSKIDKKEDRITLTRHTAGMLEQLKILSSNFQNAFQNECLEIIERAVAFHDLGKVDPSFQVNALGNRDYRPRVFFPKVQHSIFSLFWLKEDFLDRLSKLEKTDEDKNTNLRRTLCSAIAFHHWRNSFENILLAQDIDFRKAAKRLLTDEELRNDLLKNIKDNFNANTKLKGFVEHIGFNEDFAEAVAEGDNLSRYLTPPYLDYFLPQRILSENEKDKRTAIFVSGVLMRLDHFVSFTQEEGVTEDIEQPHCGFEAMKNSVESQIKKKTGLEEFNFWQADELSDLKKRDRNIILIAPTGVGKTEFAALWGADHKLFFSLPLRSAVNAVFDRMQGYVDNLPENQRVGLLHSDADLYLSEKEEESPEQKGTNNIRTLDLSRQLAAPILVSTGDQLFPSALKYPGYEKMYAALSYSRLVIDEVQAYDPKSSAIIVKLLEDVVKMGGKFLLMTATLPDFIKNEIEQRVGKTHDEKNDGCIKIKDKYQGLDNIRKHKLSLIHSAINDESVITEIIQEADKGQRILVIVNTVKQAQGLYTDIQESKDFKKNKTSLELLHSRYTWDDRKRKTDSVINPCKCKVKEKYDCDKSFANSKPEDEKRPKILISTQIIEASIDIDTDILFTEIAPLDSLVQRMGRVLRRERAEAGKKFQYTRKPNVRVYFKYKEEKKKFWRLESGGGRVYSNDLLGLSLGLLFDLFADIPSFKNLGEEYAVIEKKNKNFTEFLQNKIKPLTEDEEAKFIKSSKLLSEVDKQSLVHSLYELLPEESAYKKRFTQTLSLLDSGYMSERRSEAQKVFREIYSKQVIHENMKSELLEAVKRFCKKAEKTTTWTEFKKDIVSRFVFNINKWSYDRSGSPKASAYLKEDMFSDKKLENKITGWLDNYEVIEEGKYCHEKGYYVEDGNKSKISNFI